MSSRPIGLMNMEEATQLKEDLWHTYHNLKVWDKEDVTDLRLTVQMISLTQQRIKELRGDTTH